MLAAFVALQWRSVAINVGLQVVHQQQQAFVVGGGDDIVVFLRVLRDLRGRLVVVGWLRDRVDQPADVLHEVHAGHLLQQLQERLVEILGGGQPASVGAAGHAGRGCMRADGACARERRSLCASVSEGEGGDGWRQRCDHGFSHHGVFQRQVPLPLVLIAWYLNSSEMGQVSIFGG